MASRGLNKVMIIGNLGRDPELRFTPNGKAVASFTVAVSRIGRDAQGERTEETEWFRVVAWERLAETCNEFLKKGMKVYVEGRLQTRKYTDREGQERTSVEIVASEMVMLDSRGAPMPAGSEAPGSEAPQPVAAGPGRNDLDVDDLPF
jgi:single-strand DNA-binding protein